MLIYWMISKHGPLPAVENFGYPRVAGNALRKSRVKTPHSLWTNLATPKLAAHFYLSLARQSLD